MTRKKSAEQATEYRTVIADLQVKKLVNDDSLAERAALIQ
jgi:hypothetical protein